MAFLAKVPIIARIFSNATCNILRESFLDYNNVMSMYYLWSNEDNTIHQVWLCNS
jgi:hypothetical protein